MENQEERPVKEDLVDPTGQSTDNPTGKTADDSVATDELTAEADQNEKANAQVAELKDKYLRLYSDFENFRRRSSREKLDYLKSASEELMVALLPVLDDLERAMKFASDGASGEASGQPSVREGLQIVYNKLYKTLEMKGLKPMDAEGQLFNADFHEAITQIPAPNPEWKGKVVDEVEKGYFLNDKVIRFAKVVIGS
ncbi:MAG: nucleotide exchange factor GrpE [Ferruginibacter sp.]|nr:nucleotide exchange factor GrpE [Cytophagales bacterium]